MDLEKLTENQLKKYIETKISSYAIKHKEMEEAKRYYGYEQKIDLKERLAIGDNGKLHVVKNLPNQRLKDNQYSRILDQKVDYLMSEKPNIDGKEEDLLNDLFDKRFMRTLNYLATESYNCGISWLYVKTDGEDIELRRNNSLEIIPIWKDDLHESLEAVIKFVSKEEFEGDTLTIKHYVYLYTNKDIKIFKFTDGYLDFVDSENYLEKNNIGYDYGRIPFIYFKQPQEMILLKRVKGLQDALNLLLSNYADGMLENPQNSILVIKNYDGQDLGELRQNLNTYNTIKIRDADGMRGGVDTLSVEVNSENYKVIIELLKKAIAQNAKGLYLDNDRTTQAPNSLNIKTMYSDMELDANKMELEFTASFEYLFKFIEQVKNVKLDDIDISFKRNIMVNDESIVEMIRNSVGIVSDETLRTEHPFVKDAGEEENKIKKQNEAEIDTYNNAFQKRDVAHE